MRETVSSWTGSLRYTATCTFPVHASITRSNCRPINHASPNRKRAMNAVEIAANATTPLRRRPVAVSRKYCSRRISYTHLGIDPARRTPCRARSPACASRRRWPGHGLQDDGRADAVHLVEQAHDVDAGTWIEIAGGLVGQQHERPVDARTRDRHSLLLPRELIRVAAELIAESTYSRISGTRCSMTCFGFPITSRPNETFSNTVLSCRRRKSWKTVPTFLLSFGIAIRHPREVLAAHEDLTFRRVFLADQQADHRRLARTGLSDDEDELTLSTSTVTSVRAVTPFL